MADTIANYTTEILSVGTELLLGHVTNTDAREISEMLSGIGVNVLYHTVVGDNPERLLQCIETAKKRANLIIATGGLGPTCDDLTKQTLCRAFDMPLELDQEEYRNLYEYMSARHPYTENNTQQAMLPKGCTVFHNTCGTAPGCAFEKDGVTVMMLPGPPKECRTMMKISALPYLRQRCGEAIVSHSVRIFGLSESGVDDIFAEEMNAMTNPSMAPYAKEADCMLQITAKAQTEEAAEALCAPVMAHVRERLGDVVYGIDLENVEAAAAALLTQQGKTLAVAEGFTGGTVAARFTEAEKALQEEKNTTRTGENTLQAGENTLQEEENTLQAEENTLRAEEETSSVLKTGFVMPSAGADAEFTAALAENIRASCGADLSIAIGGESEGHFFVALCTAEENIVKAVETGTQRPLSFRRQLAGNHAFDMIRRYLTGLPVI